VAAFFFGIKVYVPEADSSHFRGFFLRLGHLERTQSACSCVCPWEASSVPVSRRSDRLCSSSLKGIGQPKTREVSNCNVGNVLGSRHADMY